MRFEIACVYSCAKTDVSVSPSMHGPYQVPATGWKRYWFVIGGTPSLSVNSFALLRPPFVG